MDMVCPLNSEEFPPTSYGQVRSKDVKEGFVSWSENGRAYFFDGGDQVLDISLSHFLSRPKLVTTRFTWHLLFSSSSAASSSLMFCYVLFCFAAAGDRIDCSFVVQIRAVYKLGTRDDPQIPDNLVGKYCLKMYIDGCDVRPCLWHCSGVYIRSSLFPFMCIPITRLSIRKKGKTKKENKIK